MALQNNVCVFKRSKMNKSIVRQVKYSMEYLNLSRLAFNPQSDFRFTCLAKYNCWSCNRVLNKNEIKSQFCPCTEKKILPVNKNLNYFELFNMKIDYNLDKSTLTKNFRQLMRKLHPDLFTQKSEKEKQYSSEQSSLVNKAYKVLNSPIERGLYMLELANQNYEKEAIESHETDNTTKMILFEIMELNEQIDEIKRPEELEELEKKLDELMRPFEDELEESFKEKDYKRAISIVSKMKYYKNVDERLKDLKLKFDLINA